MNYKFDSMGWKGEANMGIGLGELLFLLHDGWFAATREKENEQVSLYDAHNIQEIEGFFSKIRNFVLPVQ